MKEFIRLGKQYLRANNDCQGFISLFFQQCICRENISLHHYYNAAMMLEGKAYFSAK
jgi:hypothetical protein